MGKIRLDGRRVYLAEVEERYFPYIIDWRNDPENNRFLNQPFLLTQENQRAWYRHYAADDTQGLFVMVAREGDVPFGTIGWTHYDPAARVCITGRVLVGNRAYRRSAAFAEAALLHARFLFEGLGVTINYIHAVRENERALNFYRRTGYRVNYGTIRFPEEMFVNNMHQKELFREWTDYRRYAAEAEAALGYPADIG
ncbi:GNAT family N-acetyltransferase [Selenomonas sp. F0473]|uniref:GNAT family N-acetyltransferase n=1 Tax=Selenomonas sp. F0473 TaxID=999423 RepID=UPI00029EBBB9|nr:GNAT family N-acetyltransferase [Selenomonas sp. F0473]EKU72031.1 hypothetical protein HMPREF9161_00716 [Selenomonas sp. F0473]